MSQQIQRTPLGLLSVLDMKAGGINPNLMADTVAGMLDLTRLYGLPVRRVRGETVAAGSLVSGINRLVLPDSNVKAGELWHVTNITLSTPALGAGVTMALQAGYAAGGSVTTGDFFSTAPKSDETTPRRLLSGGLCDVWLLPGEGPAFFLQGSVGGGASVFVSFQFDLFSL